MCGGRQVRSGLPTASIPVPNTATHRALCSCGGRVRFRFLFFSPTLPPSSRPSPFLPLLFTDPPSRDDVLGSVPSAKAPNSSRGGLESSALKESPGGRCGNKQTVTIQRPEGSRGNEHRLFGKPTGDPDPGDASRAPLAPVPDGGGAVRGRHGCRLSCLPAAQPVHSESGSPPPRLHRRRITAAQLTAALLTAFPPTPASIPPPARLLPALGRALAFCSRGSGSPTFGPQQGARPLERDRGGAVPSLLQGGIAPTQCSLP